MIETLAKIEAKDFLPPINGENCKFGLYQAGLFVSAIGCCDPPINELMFKALKAKMVEMPNKSYELDAKEFKTENPQVD